MSRYDMVTPTVYDAVMWFCSHQFAVKLQAVGLSSGCDEEIVRGDPSTGSFSIVYLKRSRVRALDCVNATRDYVQVKRLVEIGAVIERKMLADPARSLKQLLPA